MTFSARLQAAILAKKNPVLVGLDPRVGSIPDSLCDSGEADPETIAGAFQRFCEEVIDVVAPLVPAVKPQVAFFEQYGPSGMSALRNIVRYANRQGLLVILDGKRNDIGSTATAYAQGMIGPGESSPWGADAITVSPYLGDDSLSPFVETAQQRGGGVFVLVKTSNPGGAMLQDLIAEGKPVYRYVGDYVQSLAEKTRGAEPDRTRYGSVGAVVGATWPEQLRDLRAAMPNTWFLIPGFGAQGGAAKDVSPAFDADGLGAIVNNSRGILFAYRREPFASRFGLGHWQKAVEAATREMIEQLRAEIKIESPQK